MNGLLDHVKWLRKGVAAARADFLVAGDTMQVLVRRGARQVVLGPRFVTHVAGTRLVTPELHDDSAAFLGWLPYGSRTPPLGADRAAFRGLARSLGLDAPGVFAEASGAAGDVVLVRTGSVSRLHVDGPFRAGGERLPDPEGGHYERFVEGDYLRAWFWNGTPVCAEREVTPFVVGDGASSIRELIGRRAGDATLLSPRDRDVLLVRSASVLRRHGQTLTGVLPKGARQRIEVGYGVCPPLSPDDREVFLFRAESSPAWFPALRDAGMRLLGAFPETVQRSILFTVDAILDDEGRLWLLEMNANPAVHPLCYPAMIESIMGEGAGEEPAAEARAPVRAAAGGACEG